MSYDINPDIAQAITNGRLLGTIFQDPVQIGRIAAQELLRLLQRQSERAAPKEILVPVIGFRGVYLSMAGVVLAAMGVYYFLHGRRGSRRNNS